jgi:hypothetical protein
MSEYPSEAWLRRRKGNDPVVEIAVEGGIPGIAKYVLRVEKRHLDRICEVAHSKE